MRRSGRPAGPVGSAGGPSEGPCSLGGYWSSLGWRALRLRVMPGPMGPIQSDPVGPLSTVGRAAGTE